MKTVVHTEVAASDRAVRMRVVHQIPAVAGHLPFTAADGTEVRVVGSGRPFIGNIGGKLVVGLRGGDCPDAYRQAYVEAEIPQAREAARRTKAAVAELRRKVNEVNTEGEGRRMIWDSLDQFAGC